MTTRNVFAYTAGFGALLLSSLLLLAMLLWPSLFGRGSGFSRALLAGLQLFLVWLVVTSAVRTVHRLKPRVDFWQLFAAGLATAMGGVLLKEIIWRIIGRPLTADFSGKGLLFFGGIALLASSIAVIRLRVRNRMMGQVLEFGLIATAVYLFFQTMQ
jgi:hypothetical protein